jgi:hypothetical protein
VVRGFTIHVILNLFDYHGIYNAGDDLNAAALITDFDILIETHPLIVAPVS